MIKHALRKGLSTGIGSEICGETKRLHDWQIAFHEHHWSSRTRLFFNYLASSSVHDTIDSSDSCLWALNFNKKYRFHQTGKSSHLGSIEYSPGSWNYLTTPRWIASACKTTSMILNLTPLMFSPVRTPSFETHWRAAMHESLISFKY